MNIRKFLFGLIALLLVLNISSCANLPGTKQQPSLPTKKTQLTIKIPIGSDTVYVNGEEINLSSPPAYIDEESQTTMVPLRFISEIIGAKVEWIPNTKEIIITQDDKTIRMSVKSINTTVNGKEFTLPCKPQIKEERAFVPLKFIAQNLEFIVDWIPESKTIVLYKEGWLTLKKTKLTHTQRELTSLDYFKLF